MSTRTSDFEYPTKDVENPRHGNTTRLAKLNKAERLWSWKAGIRAVICVLDIIGVGCTAWLIHGGAYYRMWVYGYAFGSIELNSGALATFGISLIASSVFILLPLLRKNTRPIHPGVAVGLDLFFWLGLVFIGWFALSELLSVDDFSGSRSIRDPAYYYNRGYYGEYRQAANGTWIYNITSVGDTGNIPHYNATTGQYVYTPVNTTGIVRDCSSQFTSCAEQDSVVNYLWETTGRRMAVTSMFDAVAWLNMLLHLTVFIWACVDCHRYNRRKKANDEKIVADRLIATLEQRGLVAVKNGVVQSVNTDTPKQATGGGWPNHD